MQKVSVIIANYNEKPFVEECLNNLKQVYPQAEIIVKDQNSQDGSAELVEQKFPQVKLIKGENTGLSKGYNTAVKQASGDCLLFLGMDARPKKGTINGILNYLNENPQVGLATAKLILKDGSLDMDARRAFPTPWISFTRFSGLSSMFPKSSLFNKYFLPSKNINKPHEIDVCISHFMMIPRKVFDEIGGFDEDYFLYGEDVDICYRIKQKGYKIMYLPQFEALHYKGGSLGIRKTTRDQIKKPLKHRLKVRKLSTEAMEIFINKHYKKKYSKPMLWLMFFSIKVLGKLRVLFEWLRG